MSILLVVQAGIDETDIKQRHALPFAGSTVLETALSRLAKFDEGPMILAISDLPDDDHLEVIAREHGAGVVRGPTNDLLSRFVEVIADYPAEHLVRVSCTSPLIDHTLVNDVVKHHFETEADYTSNTLLRTFPVGLEVEAIRSDALLDAAELANAPAERAGVSTYIHRRPGDYKLEAFVHDLDLGGYQWDVTGPSSLERMTAIASKTGGDLSLPWDAYLEHDFAERPSRAISLQVARKNVDSALPTLTEALGYPPEDLPLFDPARRTWGVWANQEDLIGAITVSVQNGWATLAGSFLPGLPVEYVEDALNALDAQLLADDQTVALSIDGTRIRQYRPN